MGLLVGEDAKLYRGWFKEMSRLLGIPVWYQYPIDKETTVHTEIKSYFSEPVKIDVIFNENPDINTLKAMNWVSENPDDKPYIAIFPWDTPNIMTKARVEICTIDSVGTGKVFEITSIKTLLQYPESYTCTLVPVFNSVITNDNYSDGNYNYTEGERSMNYSDYSNYEYLNPKKDCKKDC